MPIQSKSEAAQSASFHCCDQLFGGFFRRGFENCHGAGLGGIWGRSFGFFWHLFARIHLNAHEPLQISGSAGN
jgi:hypothetical protein